jgi:demethylmenaquinone methyltransferase/2-methoxy-6-polyprenyl-1,4-benzoquinol methylase
MRTSWPRRDPAAAPVPLAPHPPLTRYYAREEHRRGRVDGWFDRAAGDYDWINQAMSLGSGSWYREQALRRAGLRAGMRLLDGGSGTGAVAAVARRLVGAEGGVAALDPSFGMLSHSPLGRSRVRGFAETLPVGGERFDMVTMGYALRHVADLTATFAEYRRVLRPGGTLLLLEITAPASPLSRGLLGLYLGTVVPLVARLGTGGRASRELMEYHWDTIAECVRPEAILGALAGAGFDRRSRRVELGFLSEYTATR